MRKLHNLNIIVIAAVVLVLDQISKYLAKTFLSQPVRLIPDILHLTLVLNKGAGFGVLQGQRIFFVIFSLLVLGGIIYRWEKIPSNTNVGFPFGLVLGGLLGNLIDRIYWGFVIDFIDFRIWPVFNIADSCITIGVIWLVVYLWKK